MQERELFSHLNESWDQRGLSGSDNITTYHAYDHTKADCQGEVESVIAITRPPSVYDTRLRVVIVNPATDMVHIAFEGDRGENNMASYNYREIRIVIRKTNNRTIIIS